VRCPRVFERIINVRHRRAEMQFIYRATKLFGRQNQRISTRRHSVTLLENFERIANFAFAELQSAILDVVIH
jgi:hypothetical protein